MVFNDPLKPNDSCIGSKCKQNTENYELNGTAFQYVCSINLVRDSELLDITFLKDGYYVLHF